MKNFSIIIMTLVMLFWLGIDVSAESPYKIKHKDQVTQDWEIHVEYPLFERLDSKDLEGQVNHQIIQKLEDTFRMVRRGADEMMGIPFLYYEETAVIKERDFYSVVMTSHISRGNRYNSTVTSINFDNTKGGTIKKLKDLVHIDKLNKKVKKVIEQDPDMYLEEPFAGVRDDTAYYMKDGQLILVFNKFEVAAGVHGTPEIQLSLDGILKEDVNESHAPFPSIT